MLEHSIADWINQTLSIGLEHGANRPEFSFKTMALTTWVSQALRSGHSARPVCQGRFRKTGNQWPARIKLHGSATPLEHFDQAAGSRFYSILIRRLDSCFDTQKKTPQHAAGFESDTPGKPGAYQVKSYLTV
jgi:hypothetical protein